MGALNVAVIGAPLGSDDILWLLRDDFRNAASAPLTTPRPAEPGPGTLTIYDTGNKASIAGGKILWTSSTATYNPTVMGAALITRVAGRTFFFLFDHTANRQMIGLAQSITNDGSAISASRRGSLDFNGVNIVVGPDEANIPMALGLPVATGTTYQLVFGMRVAGMFYFIKGGIYTTWRLFWAEQVSDTATTSSRVPFLTAISTTSNTAADFFRVADLGAQSILSRAILLSDTFGAWPTSDGAGHVEADGIGGGHVWTPGTWSVASARASSTPVPGADMFDAGAGVFTSGVYGWTPFGTNTVANDANELKITYVDNGLGGTTNLMQAGDLTANTVPGQFYRFDSQARVNAGSTVSYSIFSAGVRLSGANAVTATSLAAYVDTLQSPSATDFYILVSGMAAGEIIWFDNLTFKPLTFTELVNVQDLGNANVMVDCYPRITGNSQAGAVVCYNPTDGSCLVARYSIARASVVLDKYAPAWSNLLTVTATYSAGALLRVVKDGTSVAVYYNNVLIGTVQTVSDPFTSQTQHGLFSTDVAAQLDAFVVWARGASGEYDTLLNRYIAA
jgi:hypothetical protein